MDEVLSFGESHLEALWGAASTVGVWVFAVIWRWVRKDRATVKQRALFESLVKRLEDASREWRVVAGAKDDQGGQTVELHEFDDEGILLSVAVPLTGSFFLSGDRVESLLSGRQHNQLVRAMLARLERLRQSAVDRALNQAIVQATR